MIYLVDKPAGWTSFDLVKKIRGILGVKKVGHAGTLDPLATGLMIIATESDTKKLTNIIAHTKTYEAEFLLGRSTTTADQEGEVIVQNVEKARQLDEEAIQEVVENSEGAHKLPVPLYSAVKVEGRKLYWYARNNITPPEIPVREMEVLQSDLVEVVDHELGKLVKLKLVVASGVYIRSIAEYVGQQLKTPAMMWGLRRVAIDGYSIKDATTIEKFETLNH